MQFMPKESKPCPCGSKKNFDQCCGVSNVIAMNPSIYNTDLENLHLELLDFAIDNFEDTFIKQTETHHQPFLDTNETLAETYISGLTIWTILNTPVAGSKQTIFDIFHIRQKDKIKRIATRNTFAKWANKTPSVYEVLAINDLATIQDISTNKTFHIPYTEEDEFLVDSLLIGTLIPYVGYHCFFFTMIEAFSESKPLIEPIFQRYSEAKGGLAGNFPRFLADVLVLEKDVVEWEDPIHETVLNLFLARMVEKGFGEEVTSIGSMIWHRYCIYKQPAFKTAGPYAAALEYFVHMFIIMGEHITQKELANVYKTSSSTISTYYQKLLHFTEKEMIESSLISTELEDTEEPSSPKAIARGKLLTAAKTSGDVRKELIEEAIAIYPLSPEAYLLLAEDADSEQAYEKLVYKAVMVGEEALGKQFFFKYKGHFWGLPETRPYMRAKAMYAKLMYDDRNDEMALKHCDELIRLNPIDNQGIRYFLLTLYIEGKKYSEAKALLESFDRDQTANFLFNKALLYYLTEGLTLRTKQFIKEANKQNLYIKEYLLGHKKFPKQVFDDYELGDTNEASAYAYEHIHLWEEYPELLSEL